MQPGSHSGPDLTVSAHLIFKAGELLRTHGAPRVELASRDSDFRTEAELTPVGELGRGVPDDDRTVDLGQEIFGGFGI